MISWFPEGAGTWACLGPYSRGSKGAQQYCFRNFQNLSEKNMYSEKHLKRQNNPESDTYLWPSSWAMVKAKLRPLSSASTHFLLALHTHLLSKQFLQQRHKTHPLSWTCEVLTRRANPHGQHHTPSRQVGVRGWPRDWACISRDSWRLAGHVGCFCTCLMITITTTQASLTFNMCQAEQLHDLNKALTSQDGGNRETAVQRGKVTSQGPGTGTWSWRLRQPTSASRAGARRGQQGKVPSVQGSWREDPEGVSRLLQTRALRPTSPAPGPAPQG